MTVANKKFGSLGEHFAKGYLSRQGFRILQAPFRCRKGEIDIVAMDGDILVFIEVKSRHSNRYGSPLESITYYKQQQIIRLARSYLHYRRDLTFKLCRFDVLGIVQGPPGNEPEIIHIKDAFRDNG